MTLQHGPRRIACLSAEAVEVLYIERGLPQLFGHIARRTGAVCDVRPES